MPNDSNKTEPTRENLEQEREQLLKRVGLLDLKISLLEERRAARTTHNEERVNQISRILLVVENIELDTHGHPFINMGEEVKNTQSVVITDESLQALINSSLTEAIGETIDFSQAK